MKYFIDYSQYSAWMKCPWYWYEKYVNKVEPVYPDAQRDDALAVGSLVHAGIENWNRNQVPVIPREAVDKIGPTPETHMLCSEMVIGYANHYAKEEWELVNTEHPVRFELRLCGETEGLAKVDSYFYVDKQIQVDSGISGYDLSLESGVWIQEYKTKSVATSLGKFMKSWLVKMQASFQLLALREELEREICGILVSVIEKPDVRVPKRKCKKCAQYFDMVAFMPFEGIRSGMHSCPMCGAVQRLNSYTQTKISEPNYYRFKVTRTMDMLVRDLLDIDEIGLKMETMRKSGFARTPANKEACVDMRVRWEKQCDFFEPHLNRFTTIGNSNYRQAEEYV